MNPPEWAVEAARLASLDSPCFSKRGVAAWNVGGTSNEPIATGYNAPPAGFDCSQDAQCKATCARFAVHAEALCLLAAGHGAAGAEMLHVKTIDGDVVPSGPPSCPSCSKLIVAAKVAGMWLLHEDGWERYEATEFHRLTIEHCRDGAGHAG